MSVTRERLEPLLREAGRLHARYELSRTVGPDYFEPGMMEYLDQSEGLYDEASGRLLLRFEAKGTRYDGRTEQIEHMKPGDRIRVVRDAENPFNSNNFTMLTEKGRNVGHMPAELCNAIAPLYDAGELRFEEAFASFVEPISRRSRHAKQAMLFVELHCVLTE
ncbi:MAG: HIRAN domain-containing protein [Oscillospiraceae bacterium]|nr:HIRAN domain-containing protein [Oscillospiraceae bacterium]